LVYAETKPRAAKPANWAPFDGFQEIYVFVGLRGGGCSRYRTRLHPLIRVY
jgi:hypothetical protein